MTDFGQPIDTLYNGYRFRSRLEARWAVFFDQLGIPYLFEPEGFELSNHGRYLPDFRLTTGLPIEEDQEPTPLWVEVKPTPQLSEEDRQKIAAFAKETGASILLVAGDPGPDANIRLIQYSDRWNVQQVQFVDRTDHLTGLNYLPAERDIATDPLASSPRLNQAYMSARSARFEHGEHPSEQIPSTKRCESCGKPFNPRYPDHVICYDCYLATRSAGLQSPSPPQENPRQNPRIRWLAIAGVAIIVLLSLGLGYVVLQPTSESHLPASTPDRAALPATNATEQSEPIATPVCACERNTYDCADFSSQSEAQACFDACFGDYGDIHNLDANLDGFACESLN